MRNLTRNFWICLGLIMFPLTTFGQQKNNFTYVPAQELLLVGKATTEGEYFHRVDTAKSVSYTHLTLPTTPYV